MFTTRILKWPSSAEDRIPYFTERELDMSAEEMVDNEISSDNRMRCHEKYRVDGDLFRMLCDLLDGSVEETPNLPLTVQVAIYLHWIAHYPTIRAQRDNFKLSHDRLHFAKCNVRNAILRVLYPLYVKEAVTVPRLDNNDRMFFFQGAYGCIDGSLFPIEVRTDEKSDWLSRKNFVSTNALLISDITGKLIFQYAMFGAEGNGPDGGILRHCCAMDLKWLPEGFLLGDAGYGLSRKILTPYRGVRYHLKEFRSGNCGRPVNKEELFNLRHSSLRNQVERAFGIMKKRFKVCRQSLVLGEKDDMWKTFYSCVAIHNFIRIEKCELDFDFLAQVIEDEQHGVIEDELINVECDNIRDADHCKTWRDGIAEDMWTVYVEEHNN